MEETENIEKSEHEIDYKQAKEREMIDEPQGHQVDFFYLIGVLYRYWKFIFIFTTIIAILSVVYVLIATPVYQSTVTLYPMNQDEGGPLKQLAITLGISNKTSGYYIIDVLNSRRIAEEIIYNKYLIGTNKDSLTLLEYWELDKMDISDSRKFEQALRSLRSAVTIKEDKETSLVSVQVNTTDMYLSKAIADKYCESVINYLNFELRNSIRESIKFTAKRLVDVRKKLADVEDDLVKFQNYNAKTNSPYLAMESKRRYQDVELMQGVVVLLEKQLELLKIEEVKDQTVINILDTPDVYDKPVEPQKRRVVMVNTFIAFLFSYVLLILREKAIKHKIIDQFVREMKRKI